MKERKKGMELLNLQMDLFTKVTLKIIKKKAKVNSLIPTDIFTMEALKIIKKKVKGNLVTQVELVLTLENSKIICLMALELKT
jgi:hypothetical protein